MIIITCKIVRSKHIKNAIASSVLLLSTSTIATAQNATSENILACRTIQNDAARLSCFDNVSDALSSLIANSGNTISSTQPNPPNAEIPLATKTSSQTRTGTLKKLSNLIGITSSSLEKEPKRSKSGIIAPDIEGVEVMTIAKVTTFKMIKKRFFMENGQVWEQVTGANLDIPDSANGNLEAHISKSGLSGYKIQINGDGWKAKVRRVR